MKVDIYKLNIYHLGGLLIITLGVLYYWNRYNRENMSLSPQDDRYWGDVSGENEFRNKVYAQDQVENTNLPYTKIPMQNDTAYITGMNKYLWNKQKHVECDTCQ
jgi:hypothetical protein